MRLLRLRAILRLSALTSSVGVCFAKRVHIYRIRNRHFAFFSPHSPLDGGSVMISF